VRRVWDALPRTSPLIERCRGASFAVQKNEAQKDEPRDQRPGTFMDTDVSTSRPQELRLVPQTATPERSNQELVDGLRAGEPWARDQLFDRYAALVERTLRRILGRELHVDLADLIHDCFVHTLDSLKGLREADALPGWIRSIAVHVAYRSIRSRRARSWLVFWEPAAIPHVAATEAEPEIRDAYVRTYAVLDRLGADDRIVFVLRHVEGLELEELATACRVSLSTAKRRLARSEQRFAAIAGRDSVLREWMEGGKRWTR
jgi:RNA polymerase sigma-70 factor, ECF subfamily